MELVVEVMDAIKWLIGIILLFAMFVAWVFEGDSFDD